MWFSCLIFCDARASEASALVTKILTVNAGLEAELQVSLCDFAFANIFFNVVALRLRMIGYRKSGGRCKSCKRFAHPRIAFLNLLSDFRRSSDPTSRLLRPRTMSFRI
jgi:hypothetical protein